MAVLGPPATPGRRSHQAGFLLSRQSRRLGVGRGKARGHRTTMTPDDASYAPPAFVPDDDRHGRMVALDIGGLGVATIAQLVGLPPDTVAAIQRSPLYTAMKQRVAEAMDGAVPVTEGRESLRKLMAGLARGQLPPGADITVTPSVMLGAARELLDREDPKVNKSQEERTVRLVIPPEIAERLGAAARALAATRTQVLPAIDAPPPEALDNFIANAPEYIPPVPREP